MPRMTPTGRPATCAVTVAPCGARLMHAGHHAAASAAGPSAGRSAGTTPAGRSPARAGHPGELGRLVVEVAVHAEGAVADRAQAAPIPSSSSISAKRPGTISPWVVLCALVREVVKPKAPAAAPPRSAGASRRCRRRSPARGGSRARPSRRRAAGGAGPARRRRSCAASVRARRGTRESSPSPICSPSASAVPGMSSTPPSGRSAPRGAPGRTGAKPTPQLPKRIVVTPCHEDGASIGSQVAWPS